MKKRHMIRNVHGIANLNLPMQSLSQGDIRNAVRYQHKLPVQPYENVTPKVLIGLDHCHLGLPTKPILTNRDGPFATITKLRVCVFGPSSRLQLKKPSCSHVSTSESRMHNLIENYFTVESFGVRALPPIESVADIRAKKLLESTTVKVNGRFQTGLLWRSDNVQLPESYSMALKRLVSIEKKIAHNEEFGKAYREIIKDYVRKGYACKLQPAELGEVGPRTWYFPHYAVVNPHKPEKLRFVFDAAATSHGVSLNSQLLKGPQQYCPLVSVLFHFREGAVAICADIQEMFHQVLIRPEDRCAQRFLWRNGDSQRTPDVYEMTAMTFGAACSPSSAHFVKVKNATEHDNYDRRAVQAITDYHYVDDYVDSFHSAKRAIEIAK
ncbi:unnamed protein product [Ceratitis capitata]|uniref:(Mediterranean fruit fly) hypothetical protein n=1 Tax=Ceratitis capitata TaxID=7213 RepID=A0A811UXT1_CERCA|nr:unnamed protein product [Ceratitis capitata]